MGISPSDLFATGALATGPHFLSPQEDHRGVRKWQNTVVDMLPEMEGSLAAGSRPSTSYGPGLQMPVATHRHRIAPEQLRSSYSAVRALIIP